MLEVFERLEQSVKRTAFHTRKTAKHTERAGHEAKLTAYHVNEYLKRVV